MNADSPVGQDEVGHQLEKIFATGEFAQAPQLRLFLSYIVARTLAGEAERIKGYTIATEALGRPPEFDPQEDAIVRVQARRLRQSLALYYAGPGRRDAVLIELPTGSYVPVIRTRNESDPAPPPPAAAVAPPAEPPPARGRLPLFAGIAAALAALAIAAAAFFHEPPKPAAPRMSLAFPTVSVVPVSMTDMPGWFSPELFSNALEEQLSRFDEINVQAPGQPADAAGPHYRVEINFSGGTYYVQGSLRLVRAGDGRIVWNGRFDVRQDSLGLYGDLDAVRKLASKLGQPFGIIYADVLKTARSDSGMACLLSGHEYFRQQTDVLYDRVSACLAELEAQHPKTPLTRVFRSYLLIEAYRDGRKVADPRPLETAVRLAREAVRLAPESARSHQALMDVLSVGGRHEEALRAGRIAVNLNPNDSDILADYGCRLALRGQYSEGRSYLNRAENLNNAPPVWHNFCLFVAANNSGDIPAADNYATRMEDTPGILANLATAIAAGRRGDGTAAEHSIKGVITAAPLFRTDPLTPMRKRGWSDDVIGVLLKDLEAAGYRKEMPTVEGVEIR